MTAIIETVSVNKRFGGMAAVSDVSLSVSAGEALAIIGPNGAGKTTFLNILSGLLSPSTGVIRFMGEDISTVPPHARAQRGLGRTMQITSVFPDLSVEDNVLVAVLRHEQAWKAFGLRSRRGLAARAEAAGIVELAGLREHAQTRCGDLAYGDQRLVEVALALGSRPKLLLLDEPAAGLSPRETTVLTAQLADIHAKTGLALIVVEHDMGVVQRLARRVAVFHLGRSVIDGPTDAVLRDPLVRDVYLGGHDAHA